VLVAIRPQRLRRLMRLSQSPNQPCEPPCGSWSRLLPPGWSPSEIKDLWFCRFTAISPTPDGHHVLDREFVLPSVSSSRMSRI